MLQINQKGCRNSIFDIVLLCIGKMKQEGNGVETKGMYDTHTINGINLLLDNIYWRLFWQTRFFRVIGVIAEGNNRAPIIVDRFLTIRNLSMLTLKNPMETLVVGHTKMWWNRLITSGNRTHTFTSHDLDFHLFHL